VEEDGQKEPLQPYGCLDFCCFSHKFILFFSTKILSREKSYGGEELFFGGGGEPGQTHEILEV